MYVFGGKNEESEKLNDLWVYNIAQEKWTQLVPSGEKPYERSGHSMSVFKDYLVIFGGIWEVTKELNDLCVYSIAKNQWVTLNQSSNADAIDRSPRRSRHEGSPHWRDSAALNKDGSPTNIDSPNRLRQNSISKKFKDSSSIRKNSPRKRTTGG